MPTTIKTHTLRRQFYDAKDSQTAELARDSQRIFSGIPVSEQRILEAIYDEPIVIGQLFEEPFSIRLDRIINLTAQTSPVLCGSLCHWTWLPSTRGGASIYSIDGLKPAAAPKYRFYFTVTYKLPGS